MPITTNGFCVDWLRFTVGSVAQAFDFASTIGASVLEEQNAAALPYYSDFRLFDFMRVDWHTLKPEMRVCLTMSGEHLRRYQAAGRGVHALVAQVLLMENITITRLDLAMDLFDDINACPRLVFAAHKNKTMNTRATTSSLFESRTMGDKPGITAYIGSRESPRVVRVYDKGAESKTRRLWTRVEIELKKPLAERAAQEIVQFGVVEAFKMEFHDFIPHTGLSWLDDPINARGGELVQPVGRKETNTDLWIHETVLPVILDAIRRGDVRVIRSTQAALKSHFEGSHGSFSD